MTNLGFCITSAIGDGTGATYLSYNPAVTEDILKLDLGRKLRDMVHLEALYYERLKLTI